MVGADAAGLVSPHLVKQKISMHAHRVDLTTRLESAEGAVRFV